MDRETFEARGLELVSSTAASVHLGDAYRGIVACLERLEPSATDTSAGAAARAGEGFARYHGGRVKDGIFGRYIIRLELLVQWDRPAMLSLAAYLPDDSSRDALKVQMPTMAKHPLATLPIYWDEMSLEQVDVILRRWLASLFWNTLSGMSIFAVPFQRQLDEALTP